MTTMETELPLNAPSAIAPTDPTRRLSRERRRTFLRRARQAGLALAIIAGVAAIVLALRPRPVPVDAARVVRGALATQVVETGTARVKDRYVVSAPVAGNLARLRLEPGDAVHEGDPLAELAPTTPPLLDQRSREQAEARLGAALSALGQARAQQARAGAATDLAERGLVRSRSLVASQAGTTVELEQADFSARLRREELQSTVFAVKVATEEVRLARASLGRAPGQSARAARGRPQRPIDRHISVLSPISGVVLRVHQKSAAVVQAGAPLVEVGDAMRLEIVADLLTTDAVRVQVGTPVMIQGWGGEVTLGGKVHRVDPSAFMRPSALGVEEQRVNVVVELSDPPERWTALRDGYRVEVHLVLWQAPDVVKVPQGAVFRSGDGWAAFRVDDGVAHLVRVGVGHRGESEVEITAGLEPGVQVAVHPGDRVKEGTRVELR